MLSGNTQVAMQIHHSVVTLHIVEIFTVLRDIVPDICVKKVTRSPRLDNERHRIISELNMLLLAKCEMYDERYDVLSQIWTLLFN